MTAQDANVAGAPGDTRVLGVEQVADRRERRSTPHDPEAAAAYDATWAIYESAAETCREVQEAFDRALETLRAVGKPDRTALVAMAAVGSGHAARRGDGRVDPAPRRLRRHRGHGRGCCRRSEAGQERLTARLCAADPYRPCDARTSGRTCWP